MSYRIRNWSEYNAGLKQRGNLTFWISEETCEQWFETEMTGKRGASNVYSDLAIITFATVKAVYRQAGRQTQGFMASIFSLMNLALSVPEHSTVSRRLNRLEIELPVVPRDGTRHVVVDSTGIKVYGEGEWKTRQHGISKRRTWRKLHLGVDETTGEILSAVVTTNDFMMVKCLRRFSMGLRMRLTKFRRMAHTTMNIAMRRSQREMRLR